jgi:beta-fructofuranosidase
MAFTPKNRISWDFWTAHDGEQFHLFYLNAPKGLRDQNHRHFYARIGHAVSRDLVNWTELPEAFGPSPEPAWDDGTTWTGSTIRRPDGKWMTFYTGTTRGEKFLMQRIGAAVSDDLQTWTKLPQNPLVEIKDTRFEKYDISAWHDEACRDPWVFQVEGDKRWHMVFTARRAQGKARGRGTIAHAVSNDLVTWSLVGEVYHGTEFGQMEVPQIFSIKGKWYCLFCVASPEINLDYIMTGKPGRPIGTHYLVADNPLGPWTLAEDQFLVADETGTLYAGRIVQKPGGDTVFLAFLNNDSEGRFVGGLSDPMPITQLPDGRLRVDATRYGIANH